MRLYFCRSAAAIALMRRYARRMPTRYTLISRHAAAADAMPDVMPAAAMRHAALLITPIITPLPPFRHHATPLPLISP